jgi:hypothetical protein
MALSPAGNSLSEVSILILVEGALQRKTQAHNTASAEA